MDFGFLLCPFGGEKSSMELELRFKGIFIQVHLFEIFSTSLTMLRDSGTSKSSKVKVSQQPIGKASGEGGSSSNPRDPWQFSERKDSAFKSLPPLPPVSARTNGSKYQYKGKMCLWLNNSLRCEHGRQKSRCKECGGSGICVHGREKRRCKDCGVSK